MNQNWARIWELGIWAVEKEKNLHDIEEWMDPAVAFCKLSDFVPLLTNIPFLPKY